jgi:hypothetical protein
MGNTLTIPASFLSFKLTYELVTEASQASADVIKAIPSTTAPKDDPGHWWRAEDLALLGTMPDAKVARRMGRTLDGVRNARLKRGIANCWEWAEEEIALVGTAPDAEIATASAARRRRCCKSGLHSAFGGSGARRRTTLTAAADPPPV